MCGRIVLSSAPHILAEKFYLDQVPELLPRFNIPPGTDIAAVVPNPGSPGRLIRMMRWGLVPPWSKGPDSGPKLINARSETVQEKPAFSEAFKNQRCLIPVNGFFEWKKEQDGKQPFLLRRRDSDPFALAGLWERWEYPGDRTLETCTIMTTAANSVMRPLHHRMPVILAAGDWNKWLDFPADRAAELVTLLQPCPADFLLAHPVTRRVNRPDFDDQACLEPVQMDGGGQLNMFE